MRKYVNISKNKKIGAVLLSLFLCTMGISFGQSRSPVPNDSPLTTVPSPMTSAHRTLIYKWLHLDEAARTALRTGDYALAEDDARQALDLHFGEDVSLKLLVQSLHAQGEDMEALPYYQEISKSGETSPDYELPYALLLLKTGQWAQSVEAYNRALPWIGDGDLLRAQSHFSPTVPQAKEMALFIHLAMGLNCLHTSDYRGEVPNDIAILNFRQALALAPNSALAYYEYGIGVRTVSHTVAAQALSQAAFKRAAALDQGDIKAAALKELPAAK